MQNIHPNEAHGHHHNDQQLTSLSAAFVVGTLLNLLFVIVEGGAGLISNSMGLLSDAGHNLSDTVSLILAWIAFRLSRKAANKTYTYGYNRSTILASLINASILLVAIGMIVIESIQKFKNPQPVDGNTIIWVAAVGVIINFATALLFMKDRKKDLNIKGAFLHMAMDALVSVGVVVSGIVIKMTGWTLIDPIIGLLVALIIFVSTWNLLKQSMRLSMDGVPEQIDVDEIEKIILSINGVNDVHHLHIWALGTSKNALTAHVKVSDMSLSEDVKHLIKHELCEHSISHVTIEIEPEGCCCNDSECYNPTKKLV